MTVGGDEWVTIACIVRPQGRHGEVLAEILTDFPDLFADRKVLHLIKNGSPAREVGLDNFWLHKGRVVLKFSGVDSISDADMLRGFDVVIRPEDRAPLDEDSYYVSDLQGCQVFDLSEERREIGRVTGVDSSTGAGVSLLTVRPLSGGEELLIPLAKSYLHRISLEERVIEMELPAGLLQINAPMSEEERRLLTANEPDLNS
ncbi:MAG: 16S rRNA processing protein RimM [Acidobacteria bacterium]|nr:16S rRNA processing protein RimM [Acidobacteriota bacterium]